jgi:hypothetical protein
MPYDSLAMLKAQFDEELRPELERYLAMPQAPPMPDCVDNLPRSASGRAANVVDLEVKRWAENPGPNAFIDARKTPLG